MDSINPGMNSDGNSQLDISKLTGNENAKIIILLPASNGTNPTDSGNAKDSVVSYVHQGFSFGVAASWGDMGYNVLSKYSSVLNAAGGALNYASSSVNLDASAVFKQRLYISIYNTIATYNGTQKPSFTIPMVFIAVKPDDDVRVNIYRLLKGVFPSHETVGSKDSPITLIPPFGYDIGKKATSGGTDWGDTKGGIVGTCSVKIGKWFKASKLIIRSVDPQFSKETTPKGWPLTAVVTVGFEAAYLWTMDELKTLFPGIQTGD
jgi:hypothetical protein